MPGLTPHHFTISVADISETVKWYTEKLGFRLIKQFQKKEMNAEIAFMELNGFYIEIFHLPESEPLPEFSKNPLKSLAVQGLKYFAFGVDCLDDAVEELRQRGVQFLVGPALGASSHKYALFQDNNGVAIELFENDEVFVSQMKCG